MQNVNKNAWGWFKLIGRVAAVFICLSTTNTMHDYTYTVDFN
jgi:hypothetical protein